MPTPRPNSVPLITGLIAAALNICCCTIALCASEQGGLDLRELATQAVYVNELKRKLDLSHASAALVALNTRLELLRTSIDMHVRSRYEQGSHSTAAAASLVQLIVTFSADMPQPVDTLNKLGLRGVVTRVKRMAPFISALASGATVSAIHFSQSDVTLEQWRSALADDLRFATETLDVALSEPIDPSAADLRSIAPGGPLDLPQLVRQLRQQSVAIETLPKRELYTLTLQTTGALISLGSLLMQSSPYQRVVAMARRVVSSMGSILFLSTSAPVNRSNLERISEAIAQLQVAITRAQKQLATKHVL